MTYRPSVSELAAFIVGALSDVFLIRNGLAYGGLTLLDKYPVLWPCWLAFILVSAFLLDFWARRSRGTDLATPARGLHIPLALLLGMVVTHTALLIRDVIADPTSHNLWPFEYLMWGLVVWTPAFVGALLSLGANKLIDRNRPA